MTGMEYNGEKHKNAETTDPMSRTMISRNKCRES